MATFTRRRKAITLVPLALVSGAWTAAMAGSSPTASASNPASSGVIAARTIPTEAVRAPASTRVPGYVAGSVPLRAVDAVVAGASTADIPAPALNAYQRAAQVINAVDTGCNVAWELLAAIGRVESDHGRSGGSVLDARGVAVPGIFGIELTEARSVQRVTDTDAGELDQDATYDRAVGPMQFLPSTWSAVKVDADGDGERNPQDIDDAALAAGVYLCSGAENLGNRSGEEVAVYRYNRSHEYVNLVLSVMDAYATGAYAAVPAGTYAGQLFIADDPGAKPHGPRHPRRPRNDPSTTGPGTPGTSEPSSSGDGADTPPVTGHPQGPGVEPVKPRGLTGTLAEVVEDPTGAATLVPEVVTALQATTTCLAQGISALDVRALATCVANLLR